MNINFIKKAINQEIDETTHNKFTRYSLGEFEKETFKIKKTKKNFAVNTGPEYCDVLEQFFIKKILKNTIVKGKIIAQRNIAKDLETLGIEPVKITGNGKKAEISEELTNEKLIEVFETLNDTALLLDLTSDKNSLKMKKSFPRGKLVEGFCKAKFALDHFNDFKEEFLWDLTNEDFKVIELKHTYIVDEIIVSDELIKQDPARARKEAKRKGKIIRFLDVDGSTTKKEFNLLA